MKKIKKYWPIIFLSLLLIVIFIANFTPGTYLAGWDNLMPEFNIWMNIKRSLLAAWQEYQGLGLAGGMGHATDLIRQIILVPFILLLPNNWIRYLWTFAMIALGTLGVYSGLKKSKKFNSIQSVFGGLFYLLNFGTIQIFWPPYDSFAAFWGFFPWLIFLFIKLLKKPTKKNWLWFVVVNVLAIPSFYIPTLFVIYGLCLAIISLFFVISDEVKTKLRNPFHIIKKGDSSTNARNDMRTIFKSSIIILLINSFWLLPFGYFLITNAHHPTESLTNQIISDQTFMRNQYRGEIKDFLLLRGYYFDFYDAGDPLMANWVDHFQKPWVLGIGYFLGGLCLLGLFSAPAWLIGIFSLSALALLSAAPPFSGVNQLLRTNRFLDQVFRAPFTKFIFPAGFSFSLLIAYSLNTIGKLINKLKLNKSIARYLLPVIFTVLILVYSYPVFQGRFIYPEMRVEIPNQYFQLFEFFKNQPQTARIANLPQGDLWGWTHYRFGLRGSGFLWYGIEQPIMDRAFDVWNLKNEQYYWDLNYALQRNDLTLLEAVLDNYYIEYVVFDDNVFFPGQKVFAKQGLKTEEMLTRSSQLNLVEEFGQIKVYRHNLDTRPFLSTTKNPVKLPDLNDYQKKEQQPIIETKNFEPDFKRCNDSMQGQRSLEKKETYYQLTARHDDACLGWWFPNLPLTDGYLLEIEYRYHQGHSPLIAAFDGQENYKFFYQKLDKTNGWTTAQAVIPPMKDQWQTGIGFTFSNISYNQFQTKNDIKNIKIYPLEFSNLNARYLGETKDLEFSSNIWRYTVNSYLKWEDGFDYLVLPQSYDRGWIAFYFNGVKPKFLNNHISINNWANGWKLPPSSIDYRPSTIYVIFWPQILEFIGLLSLIGLIIRLIKQNLTPRSLS